MSNRIGYRPFLNKIVVGQELKVMVDSNVLIANFDEVHSSYDTVRDFLTELDELADVTFYTMVTTKAEFLDYQRRRFLTENLIEFASKSDELSGKSKAKISTILGKKNLRESREKNKNIDFEDFDTSVIYFHDSEIKEIKKAFRARDVESEIGWLTVCSECIGTKLHEAQSLIDSFCEYLSPKYEHQKELFINEDIKWNKAVDISSKTGMGFSDAMILNMLNETKIDYLITLDFDLIYASAVSSSEKFVIIPDRRIKDYKQILKKV